MSPEERQVARRRADGEMYVAWAAVTQQARRIQSGEQPGPEYMADARLFAESVRWALRAGRLCALLADDEQRPTIQEALDAADAEMPNAVHVRDALEHFDDYLLNIGDQQRGRNSDDFSQVYSRGLVHEVIAGPVKIEVEVAVGLVEDLTSAVLARFEVDGRAEVLEAHFAAHPEDRPTRSEWEATLLDRGMPADTAFPTHLAGEDAPAG